MNRNQKAWALAGAAHRAGVEAVKSVLRELLEGLRVGVGRQAGVQRHQRRAVGLGVLAGWVRALAAHADRASLAQRQRGQRVV